MEGIFYSTELDLISLLQKEIPVSQALSEEQVSSPLQSAYDIFLRPLLGDEVADHFRDLTKMKEEKGCEPSDEELHALNLMRRATANLAFWYFFTELNTHITDQGFQRQEGDTFKPVYRYQELDLKQKFKNKGFNAIDSLLRYMMDKPESFPGIEDGEAWTDFAHSLVRSPKEIDEYFYVHGSCLVYLKLRPTFKRIMELHVEPMLGTKLSEALYAWLKEGTVPSDATAELMKKLREKVVPVVVCMALSEHVRNIGDITDRGLYYSNIQANSQENEATLQAGDSERARQASNLYSMSVTYQHRLLNWVEEYLPAMFAGRPEDAFERDNDNKHTFWA